MKNLFFLLQSTIINNNNYEMALDLLNYINERHWNEICICSGDPTHEERSLALATALAKIFWRAGENKTAVVAM